VSSCTLALKVARTHVPKSRVYASRIVIELDIFENLLPSLLWTLEYLPLDELCLQRFEK
jgi:hypothetical protein